jgi:hypothetical protein
MQIFILLYNVHLKKKFRFFLFNFVSILSVPNLNYKMCILKLYQNVNFKKLDFYILPIIKKLFYLCKTMLDSIDLLNFNLL